MARHIYVRSPVGVSTMTKIYGGKHNVLIYPQLYLDAVTDTNPLLLLEFILNYLCAFFYPMDKLHVVYVNKKAR